MLEYARWKYVLIAIVMLLATIYALPNIYPEDPAVQISANRGSVVDEAVKEKVQGSLEKAKISFKAIELADARVLARLNEADSQLPALQAVRDELGDNYTVALNLASTVPGWLSAIGAGSMSLGLDLRGGVHFLMEVDQRATIEKELERYADDLRTILREKRVLYRSVNKSTQGLVVTLASEAERDEARAAIAADFGLVMEVSNGPVTEGAAVLNTRLLPAQLTQALNEALEQNVSTLRNRINALGVAEPIIQRQGVSRIVVQLPGVQDTAAAKKILGATATLEYRAVDEAGNVTEAVAGRVPPDSKLYYRRDGTPILLAKRVIATGDQLIDATSGFDTRDGSPMVSVVLNNVAARRMQDFTNANVGKGMAVVFIERIPEIRVIGGKEEKTTRVKEEVISVATVREPFGKRFQTTGLDSSEEASQLALLLRAGALAAPLDIAEERIVGPSLGKDNIERGWAAVSFSFLFVLIFFVIYYKVFGLLTNLALFVNMLLVVACMSIVGATLTLPGLAGLALTVGMSVDANVLINERIREELRAGNSPLAAIATGYDKASGTIWDANITALLAGIALFAFGSGPIRGFAVTLCLGILTSIYTAVSVSRGMATLIYGGRKVKSVAI
jgi:preprotein translocase subunit SecD